MMPTDLILVRHGQSEGNVAIHLANHGDGSGFTEEFLRRHNSKWRLSERGIAQARLAGEWLKNNNLGMFDRFYVSDYLRAEETAAYLDLTNACWYKNFLLREREYGEIAIDTGAYNKDSFNKPVEPRIEVYMRIASVIQTMNNECDLKRVIIVSHGEVMWFFRLQLEQLTQERWEELKNSTDPRDRMNNGQILHYTRRDPQTGKISPQLNWMRSICPNKQEWSRPEWKQIVRHMHTNKELLSDVLNYPRICNFEY